MNINQKLSQIVQQCHSLADILDRAVRLVAEEMRTDACSIFLIEAASPVGGPPELADWQADGQPTLRMQAAWGLTEADDVILRLGEGLVGRVVAQGRPLAVADAPSFPGYRHFPQTREEDFPAFLGVPLMLRDQAVGALVVHSAKPRLFTIEEIQVLSTLASQLVGIVANARAIESVDRGERAEPVLGANLSQRPRPPRYDHVLQGKAASAGVAIGPVTFRGTYDLRLDTHDLPYQGLAAEQERVRVALEATRADLVQIQEAAAREVDEEHALIFSSHLLLLNDPVILSRVSQQIGAGQTAAAAVDRVLGDFEAQLGAVADPYIQERVEDVHDLRTRLLSHVLGREAREDRAPLSQRIVVARRIPPSLVVELKAEGALGLITETGGTTSHGVLLARSMGIPAVTGVADMAALLRTDDQVVLDGTTGRVIVNPSAETLLEYAADAQRIARLHREHLRYRDREVVTADGVRVRLQANIGVAADLRLARENGAEGVGLYRTEFPFIVREQFPTREEQVRIYRRAYEFFPVEEIRFRLLDLGGDKFVKGGAIGGSRNPFGGYRAIRVLFDHPQVLIDQVQAFALAAGERPLRILIPMVSSIEELRRVKDMISAALEALPGEGVQRRPQLGVMVEVPAAVEIAADLSREVDWLSIGTNDLTQYALAIDREDALMASTNDSLHPAILRMIRRTVWAAQAAGKSVSVCGEMAAQARLALLLVALGVDTLSVVPHALPELKQALCAAVVRPLQAEIDRVIACSDAASIDAELTRLLR